jgi:hypothetical protein
MSIEETKLEAELKAQILEYEGRIKDLEIQRKEVTQGSLEEAKKLLEIDNLRAAISIKELERQKAKLETLKELSEEEKKQLEKINKDIDQQRNKNRDIQKQHEARLKLLEKEETHQEKIRRNIIGLVKAEEQRRMKLTEVWRETQKISKEDARATLLAKLTEVSTLAAAGILRTTLEFNSLTAAMRQATNTAGELDSIITNVSRSNISFGISMENSQKALIALRQGFADMSSMSLSAQQDLTTFAAKMEKAGFDVNTTATFLNNATRSMGIGIEQAKRYQREIFLFGKANGIATKTLADGLNNVMPKLSAFGKDGIKIFKEMAFQAKNMGMEMNELLGITERMTTYEGAVEFAGQMNAILGRDAFDTIRVLRQATEDPMALIEDIRTQLQMSGKSFDQLGGQMKRAIADAAGVSVEQLAGLMKKSSAEMKAAADSEEKFNNAIEKFVPIADKMKALVSALTPAFENLANALDFAITLLTKLVQNPLAQWLITAFGAVSVFVVGFSAFMKGFQMFVSIIGTIKAALFGASAAAEAAGAGTAAASKTIGTGIQAMATSTATAMQTLATGLAAAGVTAAVAAPEIGILLLILAGLAVVAVIIAYAISIVVKSFGELFQIMINGGDASLTAAASLFIVAGAVGALGLALNLFGLAALVGIPTFLIFTAMLSVLATQYERIGLAMQFVDKAFTSLEKLTTSITQFEALRDVLAQIAEQMMLISVASLIFDKMLSNPVLPVIATAMATPKATEGASSVINAATAGSTGAKAESGQTDINLKIDTPIMLDGKKLGDFVYETVLQVKNGVDRGLNSKSILPSSAVQSPSNPRR